MDWTPCDIKIDNYVNLYTTFSLQKPEAKWFLVGITSSLGNVFYNTLRLDDERQVAIIGDEELYCWKGCTIFAFSPINTATAEQHLKVEEPFAGTIFVNGIRFREYNSENRLFDDYDSLVNNHILIDGAIVAEDYNLQEGYSLFYNTKNKKSVSISYETNRKND